MRSRPILLLTLAALLGGCATTGTLGPEGVARLEQARAANPQSAAANRALGIAYYQLNRYPDARAALEKAASIDPGDGTTQLFLGMTAEAQGDLAVARKAYSSYVEHGRTARVRKLLEDHLAALNQKELAIAAKQALADEAKLASVPGKPNTVAVLPLSFTGSDTTLRPLGRGLAELLTTDLAQSSKLTVLERARVQALIDEMQLQQSGATDQSTNVRAGRMLEAGRLVAGGITQSGEDLRVDAPIVNVSDDQVVGSPSDSRSLDDLFTLEKNLAFGIFNSLGITLTTDERNRIEQRPTKSLAAFLAYSRGLTYQDEGRFDDATQLFDQALRLDPGFSAARQSAQQSSAAAQGQNVTTATVETGLRGTAEGTIVTGATQGVVVTTPTNTGLASTAQSTAAGLNPSTASVATTGGTTTTTQTLTANNNGGAAATGTNNITQKTATISIVVKIPHL